MNTEKVTGWRKTLPAALMLGAGLLFVEQLPAAADPPPHARAYGYRWNQTQYRDNDRRDWNDRWNSRDNNRGRNDRGRWDRWDRDRNDRWDNGNRPRSQGNSSWDYRDSDGDGVRNRWDRSPYNRYRR
jgi:hypothetical protein